MWFRLTLLLLTVALIIAFRGTRHIRTLTQYQRNLAATVPTSRERRLSNNAPHNSSSATASTRQIYKKSIDEPVAVLLRTLAKGRMMPKQAEKNIYFIISSRKGNVDTLSGTQWKALHACAVQYRLPAAATAVFEEMIERQHSFFSSTITEHINLLCSKQDFNQGLYILDKLQEKKQPVNLQHFVAALRWSGSVDRAWSVLQRMKFAGIPLNVISFTSAIKSCESTGDWTSALELLDLMRLNGIQPNEITYTVVISVLGKLRLGEIALALLREMLNADVAMNSVVYGSTISACARSNMWVEVDMLLQEMVQHDLQITHSVLNSAITACRDDGQQLLRYAGPNVVHGRLARSSSSIRSSGGSRIWASGRSSQIAVGGDAEFDDWVAQLYQQRLYPTAIVPSSDVPRWQRAQQLLNQWAQHVKEGKEDCYSMVMELMQIAGRHDEVLKQFWTMLVNERLQSQQQQQQIAGRSQSGSSSSGGSSKGRNVASSWGNQNGKTFLSKGILSLVMHSCVKETDAGSALYLLELARQHDVDTPTLYNASLALCHKAQRTEDSVLLLHKAIVASERGKLPAQWLMRQILASGLRELTANFSACFTEVVDGRLSPSAAARPLVDSLTAVLQHALSDSSEVLPAVAYPMANKLLLDCGDYKGARQLLKGTLQLADVNSTRLYDFALRSLIRSSPTATELSAVLDFIEDLSSANCSSVAAHLCLETIKVAVYCFSKTVDEVNAAVSNSSDTSSSNTSIDNASIDNTSNSSNSDMTLSLVQANSTDNSIIAASQQLTNFFESTLTVIAADAYPDGAFKEVARAFKHAAMLDELAALYNNAVKYAKADKQLKGFVAFSLAKSPTHWSTAVEIVLDCVEDKSADLVMFKSALIACETGGACDRALWLLEAMQQQGHSLCALTANAAIAACATCGRPNDVFAILDSMVASNIQLERKSLQSAIIACAKRQQWQTALRVYEIMHETLLEGTGNSAQDQLQKFAADPIFFSKLGDSSSSGSDRSSSSSDAFGTLIEVLGNAEQLNLLDDVYAEAIKAGMEQPFAKIGSGFLDLHQHSAHMAEAVLRFFFNKQLAIARTGSESVQRQLELVEDMTPLELRLVEFLILLETLDDAVMDLDKAELIYEQGRTDLLTDSSKPIFLVIITGKNNKRLDSAVQEFLRSKLNPTVRSFKSKSSKGRVLVPLLDIFVWLGNRLGFVEGKATMIKDNDDNEKRQ